MKLRMHPGSGGNVQDPVGHEDSSAASAEDAKFEDCRGVIIDPAADAGFGATRRRKGGKAGGCEIRGNPEIHQPAPKERSFGATRRFTIGTAGRCRIRGNPEPHQKAALEERGSGATWISAADAAEGCESRGNSRLCRRQGRKMQDTGQPGTSSEGAIGGAGSGATRSLTAGSAKGCEIRGNSKIHRRQGLKKQVARRLVA